jgi:hypothetical protein
MIDSIHRGFLLRMPPRSTLGAALRGAFAGLRRVVATP